MKVEFKLEIDNEKYGGKYVAIVDDEIVASGEDARTVWEMAKKAHPTKLPALMKVSKPGTYILMICK